MQVRAFISLLVVLTSAATQAQLDDGRVERRDRQRRCAHTPGLVAAHGRARHVASELAARDGLGLARAARVQDACPGLLGVVAERDELTAVGPRAAGPLER